MYFTLCNCIDVKNTLTKIKKKNCSNIFCLWALECTSFTLLIAQRVDKFYLNESYMKWYSKKSEINKAAVYCENCILVIAYLMMPETYSEPYQRSKMECFAKIVNVKKTINYFRKTLNSRCFTGFWICFWVFKSIFYLFLLFQNGVPWWKRGWPVTTHQAFSSLAKHDNHV